MAKGIEIGAIFCATELDDIAKKIKSELSGKKKNLTIELAKVERVDTLALQLLVSTQNTCIEKGGTLTLKNIPEVVTSTVELLGLSVLTNE